MSKAAAHTGTWLSTHPTTPQPHRCRCGRAPDDISSIVLVEEGAHYIKSDAILRIATRLALPLPVVAAALMPLPYFIKDTVYDQVRYQKRCAAIWRMLGSAVPSLMQVLLRLTLDLAQIASNRYSFFGKTDACRVSADGFQDRFLGA